MLRTTIYNCCKFFLAFILALSGSFAFAAQDSSVFTFDGQDFVRSETTLLMEDGSSAVNTKLDHDNPAYDALKHNHSYSGEATIFGKTYEAFYAPLTDSSGQVTGAIFVGNKK